MDFPSLVPVLTSLGTFVGGGLIGATITMISDGRLNRRAIDAQLKAEQREVVAQMLSSFQRATNALAMLKLEKHEDVQRFNHTLGRFVQSGEEALEHMPWVELTVRDAATRRSLMNFLTKLGLIMHDYMAPLLGSHSPQERNELQRKVRLLKSQGKELNEYYEKALSIARNNLRTDPGAPSRLGALRHKREKLPALQEVDQRGSDRLQEVTFRRFDPDFITSADSKIP